VSAAQIAQWIHEYWWTASLPPGIWGLQRTRTIRTIATVIRGEVRDRWLRAKNVPEQTRQELAVDAVKRDLES
jgi:hypothetical protein